MSESSATFKSFPSTEAGGPTWGASGSGSGAANEDEWELPDAADLGNLTKILAHSSKDAQTSFAVVAPSGASSDFGFVGIRHGEIASWHIDGLFDPAIAAPLAAELQGLEGDDEAT